MPRYATIITGDDGQDVVSAIGEFEGAAPQSRLGRIEQVAPGVRIGMVRGAGGFSFPQPETGGPVVGLILARLEARARVAGRAVAANLAPAKQKRAKGKAAKKKPRSKKPARSISKAGFANCAGDAADTGRADV
ncbi:hypothetical protein [Mesorhizobium sp. ES1-1]|uniref:hypothetical protein n=1 Tax=Mesorhizobium sp. ES1-1 TaxID=2876629 RepID=UPI001CCBC357|nr:hypothetical protein [Mesorhizobium sp. ES1-1]MBZ9675707.1 hypothetical protein [Mesorhizobium sp. ES1-1]